jgi:hypothetical protein
MVASALYSVHSGQELASQLPSVAVGNVVFYVAVGLFVGGAASAAHKRFRDHIMFAPLQLTSALFGRSIQPAQQGRRSTVVYSYAAP